MSDQTIYDDVREGEPLIALVELPAAPFMPRRNGKKANKATIFRHHQIGIDGHRLEAIKAGGRLCTTQAAVERFWRALSGESATATGRSPKRREREIEAAERRLAAAGCM